MRTLHQALQPHQHFLVVLARRPDSYGYVKTLESVTPRDSQISLNPLRGDYVTVIPNSTRYAPLPSWSPMWTSIAYIIWDDYDASLMTAAQKRAMVDWLHWGGQLIVSGPESLESLRSSFLRSYLPGQVGQRRPIQATDIHRPSVTSVSIQNPLHQL